MIHKKMQSDSVSPHLKSHSYTVHQEYSPCTTLLIIDWQDIHSHRNNKTTRLLSKTCINTGSRTLKHLSRQSVRTSRTSRHSSRPSRSSSAPPPFRPRPFPRCTNTFLRSRCPPSRRKRRRRQSTFQNQKNPLRQRTKRNLQPGQGVTKRSSYAGEEMCR